MVRVIGESWWQVSLALKFSFYYHRGSFRVEVLMVVKTACAFEAIRSLAVGGSSRPDWRGVAEACRGAAEEAWRCSETRLGLRGPIITAHEFTQSIKRAIGPVIPMADGSAGVPVEEFVDGVETIFAAAAECGPVAVAILAKDGWRQALEAFKWPDVGFENPLNYGRTVPAERLRHLLRPDWAPVGDTAGALGGEGVRRLRETILWDQKPGLRVAGAPLDVLSGILAAFIPEEFPKHGRAWLAGQFRDLGVEDAPDPASFLMDLSHEATARVLHVRQWLLWRLDGLELAAPAFPGGTELERLEWDQAREIRFMELLARSHSR